MPNLNQALISQALAEYAEEILNDPQLAASLQDSEGFCSGFTTLWIYAMFMGEVTEETIKAHYEKLINNPSDEKNKIIYEKILRYIKWLQKPQSSGIGLIQDKVDKLLEDSDCQPLQEEHKFGWVMDNQTLKNYLTLALKDNCAVRLSVALDNEACKYHALGLIRVRNTIYFYDANKDEWKTLCNNLDEVISEITQARQRLLQENSPPLSNYFGVGVNTLRMHDQVSPQKQSSWEIFENALLSNSQSVNQMHDLPQLTTLFMLSSKGCTTSIQKFFEKNPDYKHINKANSKGTSPLITAAQRGHTETVDLLLKRGADINAAKQSGVTSLYLAAQNGHIDTVKLLLARGANINATTHTGGSPLYTAARNGHEDVVKLLLERGAHINGANHLGVSPLHMAAQNGHENVVKLLLDKGADVNKSDNQGATPLFPAVLSKHGSVNIIKLLLERNADVNVVNTKGDPLLYYLAACEGCIDKLTLLLEYNIDVNKTSHNGKTPLYVAADERNVDVIKLLIDHGAAINKATSTGETPLLAAVIGGNIETVQVLCSAKANPNYANNHGHTPLMQAAYEGNMEIVKLLLASGADPMMSGSALVPVLLEEADKRNRRKEVKNFFESMSIDILNTKMIDEFSAIHFAVFFGHKEVVITLLNRLSLELATINSLWAMSQAMNHTEISDLLMRQCIKDVDKPNNLRKRNLSFFNSVQTVDDSNQPQKKQRPSGIVQSYSLKKRVDYS